MKVKIISNAFYLPEYKENNNDLKADNPNWNMQKISEKTGIFSRSIASPNQTALDLGLRAGEKLLSSLACKTDIDLLVLVTQSPEYVLPSGSCILQNKLGLSTKSLAFDINLGCSGFIYALSVVGGLIESGIAKKGLIICSDTYSKYIDKKDRTCRPIFSDGASATLLAKSDENNIGPFVFGTDGSGYDKLIVRENSTSGIKQTESRYGILEMSGADVFLFTLNTVPACLSELLQKSKLTIDDIDLFVFHQASKLVIDNIIRAMGINENNVFINLGTVGNTVSASIPIALKEAEEQGKLKDKDKVALVGFGVGLSWGSTILTWRKT